MDDDGRFPENQIRVDGAFRGFLWGASYTSDFDLDSKMRSDRQFLNWLASGFAEIERLDFKVSSFWLSGGGGTLMSDEEYGTTAVMCPKCQLVYTSRCCNPDYVKRHSKVDCDLRIVEGILNS